MGEINPYMSPEEAAARLARGEGLKPDTTVYYGQREPDTAGPGRVYVCDVAPLIERPAPELVREFLETPLPPLTPPAVIEQMLAIAGRQELTPAASQKIRNHSPDGFQWGYGGSGPAQLALAILLDFTGSAELAQAHYQAFKWARVARFSYDTWRLTGHEIRTWLAAAAAGGELREIT